MSNPLCSFSRNWIKCSSRMLWLAFGSSNGSLNKNMSFKKCFFAHHIQRSEKFLRICCLQHSQSQSRMRSSTLESQSSWLTSNVTKRISRGLKSEICDAKSLLRWGLWSYSSKEWWIVLASIGEVLMSSSICWKILLSLTSRWQLTSYTKEWLEFYWNLLWITSHRFTTAKVDQLIEWETLSSSPTFSQPTSCFPTSWNVAWPKESHRWVTIHLSLFSKRRISGFISPKTTLWDS